VDYPYGPKKPHGFVRALDVAGKIYDPIPEASDESPPSAQQIAAWRVEQWGVFAREQGFSYRERPAPGEVESEPLIAEMRRLSFPLNEVAGWCEGSWQGVPFTSYAVVNFGEGGSWWPYRFICTPLQKSAPDLVHDSALRAKRPYHLDWYPSFGEYQLVEGPQPKKTERKPGLLGRALDKGKALALEAIVGADARDLHAASVEHAAVIVSRPFEEEAYRRDWAVKDRWLVVFQKEGRQGSNHARWTAQTLDAFAAVKRLVDLPE
jgi:hypothetical protein